MEPNNRASPEVRPTSAGFISSESSGSIQAPVRPPLNRVDSKSTLPPQSPQPRPGVPVQQRPYFQPGGPVNNPPQFVPRPGTPTPRAPITGAPGIQQQPRPQQPPTRPSSSFIPQQGPRPLQSPTAGQTPQRVPPPNNLQFGPRQPPQFTSAITPDGSKPSITQQPIGVPRNGAPPGQGQLLRQTSQGSIKSLDNSNSHLNKSVNLDNQTANQIHGNQNDTKTENGVEISGVAKGRSYSIAAAPGTPSPFKMEDDRRKSISAIGGRIDEISCRSPGLGLIHEGKIDSKDSVHDSKESIKAGEVKGIDIPDRPESRLTGSKMTESFIGSLSNSTQKKKLDDDDDVVLQNNTSTIKITNESQQQKELSDRSPSLTRSDDSPEPKKRSSEDTVRNKSQSVTPEPHPLPTLKTDIKEDIKSGSNKDIKPIATPTKAKSPIPDSKSSIIAPKKPTELYTSITPEEMKKSTPRKTASAPKSRQKDGDNDSGVDESTQGNDVNGSPGSPTKIKTPSKISNTKEKSSSSLKQSLSRSSSKSATPKTPENPLSAEKKKVPMNKIQVGNAPSPNIKTVRSKIGSLENSTYKPGGGKVKIENRKLDFNKVTPKIAAKNDAYIPSGGTKKITTTKLEWNAKSKVGSLQNTAYKPGGGDKKIETVKLDFKDKAKPKVASTANINHKPGGGSVKSTVAKNGTRAIENQKLDIKAQSKVGSMDNVKHKPGGGDIKIFDDKDYVKQMSGQSPLPSSRSLSRQEEHYYISMQEWSEEERPMSRCKSARTPLTPRALSPRRQSIALDEEHQRIHKKNERNRRFSMFRPTSARDPPRSACTRGSSLTKRPAFTLY